MYQCNRDEDCRCHAAERTARERQRDIICVTQLLKREGYAVTGVTTRDNGSMAVFCLPPPRPKDGPITD